MRVLRTLTGKAAHLPARNAYDSREPFPVCTPVGTAVVTGSGGITRFYPYTGDVTCKRCLAALERAHAEAIAEDALRTATASAREELAKVEAEVRADLETEARAMHAQHMMTPEGQAQEDELAARRAEKCGQCGSERSNPRHHSAEGHAFVEPVPAAQEAEPLGMYVELASGLPEYVERGDRLQHKDSGERGMVTAVGPNALDLRMDDGTPRSVASWFWGRPSLRELVAELPEVAPKIVIDPSKYDSDAQLAEATAQVRALRAAGPTDRQAVLSTGVGSGVLAEKWSAPLTEGRGTAEPSGFQCTANPTHIYTPNGEAALVLGSGTHGGLPGVWALREGNDPQWGAFFVDEDHLRLQFSAYRPGERARLADAARVATSVATPSQVADLTTAIAQQAELFAAGGVTGPDLPEFRARMERNVRKLAAWLGMSEPVKLASYASPYGGPDLAEVWQARAGVQPLLCRLASSRWTTYGATCNTPLSVDGTCPEAHAHV
jgi:hypothetical protein